VDVGIGGGAVVGEDGGIRTAAKVDVEDGIGSGAKVGEVDGIGTNTEYGVEGENKSAQKVGLDGGAEVSEEELFEGHSESGDDFDVHSWNESEEELSSADAVEDGLFDVPIGGDDAVQDDLFEVRIKEGKVGGVRGSSSQKPNLKHVDQRGFSDTEWQSETLDNDTSDEDKDIYGSFGIFSKPKNMEDYNWEVGTYFTEKETLH